MNKGTLIAIGTFVVLLAAVLLTRDHGNVSEGMPTLKLSAVDPTAVTTIEISGPVTTTLKKEGTGWTVVDPKAGGAPHAADEMQVNNLLGQLKDVKVGAFVTDKADKQAEYEVDAAKGLTVKASGASGTLLTAVFGKAAKTGGGFYLRGDGSDQIFTTSSTLSRVARRDAKGWRKRTFFPVQAADLSGITTTFDDGTTLSLQAVDGGWGLAPGTTTPPDFRFDPAAATRVSNAVAGLSANDFGDAMTDQAAGFAGPHTTIKTTRKDGTNVTVQLAHPAPAPLPDGGASTTGSQYAVRVDGDPQIYLVATFQADAAIKRVTDLRDLSLLAFDPAAAKAVTIHGGGKATTATKTNGTWTITDPKALPPGFDYDPTQVASFIGSLRSTRGTRVIEGATVASAGLGKPLVTVDLELEGAPTQHLIMGGDVPGPQTGQVYVQGSIDKLIYAMPAAGRVRFERGVDLFKRPPKPLNPTGGMGGMGAPGGMGGQGLNSLPPEIRAQIEAQLRQQGQKPH